MAKLITVTKKGGLANGPANDTPIIINTDKIVEVNDTPNPSIQGESEITYDNNTGSNKKYYVVESKAQIQTLANA